MTFLEYSQIMREHGIGELSFLYDDKQYWIDMEYYGLNLYYIVYDGDSDTSFDHLDDLFDTKIFNGKSLEDIWSEVEILEIDGVSLEKYDVDTCSFDYVAYIKEQGEMQWSCSLGRKKSFFIQLN